MENVRTAKAHDPIPDTGPYFVGKSRNEEQSGKPDRQKQLARFRDWEAQAKQAWAETRAEMAKDEDYKDGDQWTPEEIALLEERGQAPLVFNLCKQSIKWLTGTERRTRVDFKVVPRKKEHGNAAEEKTNLLKFISDFNRAPFRVSKAFERAVTSGLGWLEESVNSDPSDEAVDVREVSWRFVWHDPFSREDDLSDARYLFVEKPIDLDLAQAMFPEHKEALRHAADNMLLTQGEEHDELLTNPYLYDRDGGRTYIAGEESWNSVGRRQRVKMRSIWYREPMNCQVVRGDGAWDGAVYNQDDETLRWVIEQGLGELVDSMKMVMHHAVYCDNILLVEGKQSPYWHNKMPLTPVWCYRRERDGMPYGVIRGMRDPQDDYNKRRSKALHILSAERVIMDEGAVDDLDEFREEVAKPDAIIIKKANKDLRLVNQSTLAAQHIEMMHSSEAFIQSSSGVTDELMGRQTNAQSGKAVEARQNQGVATTMDIFDQLRQTLQLTGEKQLRLAEQFFDEDRMVRILGDRARASFVNVSEEGVFFSKSDFVVDEQAFQASTRHSMFEAMIEMVRGLDSQIAIQLLDLVFDLSDLPQREEIVARIRTINGQQDPDHEMTEEEVAEQQQQKQQQQELQMREVEANLQLLEGKAKDALASGDKKLADAIKAKLESMQKSLDVATTLRSAPQLGQVADEVIQDATQGTQQS